MSLTLGINKLKVEQVGNTVNVPQNHLAKLMYYLACVFNVIKYDKNKKLIDYEHYDDLDNDEVETVYKLATLFNPKLFIDAGIFILDGSLLVDSNNTFFRITDENIGVHVNEEIMIGGKTMKVLNIMACDYTQLRRNYYTPLENLKTTINNSRYITATQNNTEYSTIRTYSNRRFDINQNLNTNFESPDPISVTCYFCKENIKTETECECNCLACCLCFFFCCPYVCIQTCRGKSICCFDEIHKCPHCGKILGKYNTC